MDDKTADALTDDINVALRKLAGIGRTNNIQKQ